MPGPARVGASVWGESYDQYASVTFPQHPLIDGPFFINALPDTTDYGLRVCAFFNPWGGVEPSRYPQNDTLRDWDSVYPDPIDQIDWTQTGGWSVWAQRRWTVGSPNNEGFDQWMHKGNDVPDNSNGQSQISSGYICFSVCGTPDANGATRAGGYDDHYTHWSFNPNPAQGHGIGRDGYYPGSHKHGNGTSGTMPGVFVQQPGDLQVLLMAHLNLQNAGNIQQTQHGGPQDVGWTYHGIKRPHRFFYASQPRQWGVVLSLWSRTFNDYVGYTGDIPWRINIRDPNYQMQSIIMSFRGKPIGQFGGGFA